MVGKTSMNQTISLASSTFVFFILPHFNHFTSKLVMLNVRYVKSNEIVPLWINAVDNKVMLERLPIVFVLLSSKHCHCVTWRPQIIKCQMTANFHTMSIGSQFWYPPKRALNVSGKPIIVNVVSQKKTFFKSCMHIENLSSSRCVSLFLERFNGSYSNDFCCW